MTSSLRDDDLHLLATWVHFFATYYLYFNHLHSSERMYILYLSKVVFLHHNVYMSKKKSSDLSNTDVFTQ